jgi:sugar/nucleoside kinase (ribokinase family)
LLLERTLPFVDIFQPSVEELLYMLRHDTYQTLAESPGGVISAVKPDLLADLSEELLSLGVKIVLIKLGERGAYLRTAGKATLEQMGKATPKDLSDWSEQQLWAPRFEVKVVGTTGSGDAAIAGLLSAVLRNTSPQLALTMAVAVGACSVEGPDPLSCVLTWEDTVGRINHGWQRHPLDLSPQGWYKDGTYNLWNKP